MTEYESEPVNIVTHVAGSRERVRLIRRDRDSALVAHTMDSLGAGLVLPEWAAHKVGGASQHLFVFRHWSNDEYIAVAWSHYREFMNSHSGFFLDLQKSRERATIFEVTRDGMRVAACFSRPDAIHHWIMVSNSDTDLVRPGLRRVVVVPDRPSEPVFVVRQSSLERMRVCPPITSESGYGPSAITMRVVRGGGGPSVRLVLAVGILDRPVLRAVEVHGPDHAFRQWFAVKVAEGAWVIRHASSNKFVAVNGWTNRYPCDLMSGFHLGLSRSPTTVFTRTAGGQFTVLRSPSCSAAVGYRVVVLDSFMDRFCLPRGLRRVSVHPSIVGSGVDIVNGYPSE